MSSFRAGENTRNFINKRSRHYDTSVMIINYEVSCFFENMNWQQFKKKSCFLNKSGNE